MIDLESQNYEDTLNEWLKSVEKISTKMTTDEKAKVTEAGAKVFADRLESETRAKHYSKNIKLKDRQHLADTVTIVNKNIDNKKTGVSTVGFLKTNDKDYSYGYIARFLNDGTKHINGDSYIDDLRKDIMPDVVKAEKAEYSKLIKKKGDV